MRKYVRIFVLWNYFLTFLEAHSFPRAKLEENCSLLGADNVPGQISEHIFAPNGGYRLYIRYVRMTIAKSNMTIFGQCCNLLNDH